MNDMQGITGQDRLIQHLWDAALTTDWQPFLERLGNDLRGDCATLFQHDYANGCGQMLAAYGVDKDMQAKYDAHYCRTNVWVDRQAKLPAGSVVRSEQLLSLAELQRSEYYADWLRPQGLCHALGSTVVRDEHLVVKLGLLRGPRGGSMRDVELQAVRSLMPHLERAVKVSQQLRLGELGNLHADQAFEANQQGLLLIDKELVVHRINHAAARTLEMHDGVSIDLSERLRILDMASARALLTVIAAVLERGIKALGHRRLTIPRPSGRPAFIVQVMPAPQSGEPLQHSVRRGARLLMVMADPARVAFANEASAIESLRWQFGLSKAEARLAMRLADGHTLVEAAQSLRITEGTARFVSKQVMRKCDVHRQADLIRLILNSQLG